MNLDWLKQDADYCDAERRQLHDEGRDPEGLPAPFRAYAAGEIPGEPVDGFSDAVQALPQREGYPYVEPDGLEAIQAARPAPHGDGEEPEAILRVENRIRGAWLGRAAGCLLGKPIEGWRRAQIETHLRLAGAYPLKTYFRSTYKGFDRFPHPYGDSRACVDRISCMPADDDLNYTVLALEVMERHGADFTSEDVARAWLEFLPALSTFTAERITYRNLLLGISPPESARYRNPYREWIGAQIRADFYGYACLGDPAGAAALAWRDARVSHVKNGIYGAMWVAAMIAGAPHALKAAEIIQCGLDEIPAQSRLAEAVRAVLAWRAEGMDYDAAAGRIHGQWDESNAHHWCHTISNAQIVAAGLLWGNEDFTTSICRAVQAGFDTDCNGATVGSIMGVWQGADSLPGAWIAPLNGAIETSLVARATVPVAGLVGRTLAVQERVRSRCVT